MKVILEHLKSPERPTLTISRYEVYILDDGKTITARQMGTGLMGPLEKATVAGFSKVIAWIREELRAKKNPDKS